MNIYLDFDGTVVEHEYPKMGRENFGWHEVVYALQKAGHEVILNTYRADCNDGTLQKALGFINLHHRHDLPYEIKATLAKIHPEPWEPMFFELHDAIYIDDMATGMPVKKSNFGNPPMVDWKSVDVILMRQGIYNASHKPGK